MSCHLKVYFFSLILLCTNWFVNGYVNGYPGQYNLPYPYIQHSNFGEMNIAAHPYPYSYPPYPSYSNYASQYPYPGYYPYLPYAALPPPPLAYPPPPAAYPAPAVYPEGNVYPLYPMPYGKPISTPYGNIPVEYIDVNEDEVISFNESLSDSQIVFNSEEQNKTTNIPPNPRKPIYYPYIKQSNTFMDVLAKPPVKTTTFLRTEPSQTKIIRTFKPKGKVHVEIQTENSIINETNIKNKTEV